MNKASRIEPQYAPMKSRQAEQLGLSTGYAWQDDPKRLAFTAARYKFVGKMLADKMSVLEVGCGDAFFTRIVQQMVHSLVAIDFDEDFVVDVRARMSPQWPFECRVHDMVAAPFSVCNFSGAYALDVLEHIDPKAERVFIHNMARSVHEHGVVIIGTPSLASQKFASKLSKEGHVNCKDGVELKKLMREFFHNVFMFSMNDEVVHTGHDAMAHYLFAVCAGRR